MLRPSLCALIPLTLALGARGDTCRNFEVFAYDGRAESDGRTAFANGNSTLPLPTRIAILQAVVRELETLYEVNPRRSPLPDEAVRQALAAIKPRPLPILRGETDLSAARVLEVPRAHRGVYHTGFEPEENWREYWETAQTVDYAHVAYGAASARVVGSATPITRALVSNPEKLPLARDTFYRVSFDYRVLASPAPGAKVHFYVQSDADGDRLRNLVGRRAWREGMGVAGRKQIEFHTGPRDDYRIIFSTEGEIDWLIDNFELEEAIGGAPPAGWQAADHDDARWRRMEIPQRFPHSHTTLLRLPFQVADTRSVRLFSAGIRGPITLWVNGQEAARRRNEHPFTLDITRHVRPGANLLAIQVDPEYRGQGPQGRITILQSAPVFLSDLFVSTLELSRQAARLRWRVTLTNDSDRAFEGSARLRVTPWLPEESEDTVGEAELTVSLAAGATQEIEGQLTLPNPAPWSPDSPALYKARVVLADADGELDDVADSFGVRIMEQRDGELYLNGEPFVLRGAGDFSVYPPLSSADLSAAVPPRELLARNVLLLKLMNANTFRWFPGLGFSALDYESRGHPSNDEMIPALCDQLGMMLQWGAGFWVWQEDRRDDWREWFSEAIPPALRLLRNRPSVLIWEAGNENWHGLGRAAGTPRWSEWWDFCYELIERHDDSRLILPSSYGIANRDIERALAGEEVAMPRHWRAPNVLWDVHFYPGWYEHWDYVAPAEDPGRRHWLQRAGDNGPDRRPFLFGEYGAEAMPVWDLYAREEWNVRWMHWDNLPMGRFEARNIGRALDLSEWELSQAYQALILQHVTTMGRLHNVDGFMVCALADTQRLDGTYHKGVCDVYRIPKYGFYSLRMVYQDLYLSATRGDMMLGQSDRLAPLLFNWGPAARVKGTIVVESETGRRLLEQPFGPVEVPAHGCVEACPPLEIAFPGEGVYVMRAELQRL